MASRTCTKKWSRVGSLSRSIIQKNKWQQQIRQTNKERERGGGEAYGLRGFEKSRMKRSNFSWSQRPRVTISFHALADQASLFEFIFSIIYLDPIGPRIFMSNVCSKWCLEKEEKKYTSENVQPQGNTSTIPLGAHGPDKSCHICPPSQPSHEIYSKP